MYELSKRILGHRRGQFAHLLETGLLSRAGLGCSFLFWCGTVAGITVAGALQRLSDRDSPNAWQQGLSKGSVAGTPKAQRQGLSKSLAAGTLPKIAWQTWFCWVGLFRH